MWIVNSKHEPLKNKMGVVGEQERLFPIGHHGAGIFPSDECGLNA